MSRTISFTMPSSALRWLALGGAVGLLVAAAGAPAFAPRNTLAVDSTAPEHTISVTGTGRVSLTPDVADVRLGVNIIRPTATEARTVAAAAMNKVVDALRKAGIADKDIQTSTLSLQPVYDYSTNGNGKLTGFQLTNSVAVIVHNVAKVGELVDAAVTAGATSVDGISFRVDNPAQAESQARTAAVADAKAKATVLAAAAGVTISGVSSISESVSPMPYPIAYAAGGAKDAMSTPVLAGTTEIDVVVNIVYRIP